MTDYPKRQSDVEITFLDGEVQTVRCGFGSTIASHLAKQTSETGIITLLCGAKTYSFPLSQIRAWTITEIEKEVEPS